MIIPDVNLLIYAYDTASPFHQKAVNWWQDCLSGTEPVGLPAVVVFGFVRMITNIRLFNNPMTPAEAADHVRSWLGQPNTQILAAGENHVAQVLHRLELLGTAGNLSTDTQIAELASEYDAVIHTNDTDFARFEKVQCFNPLKAAN